jgi:serine protease Do
MRKALMAGAALVAVVAAAYAVAPTAWSQGRDEDRDRRVFMLDGRGMSIGVSVSDRGDGGVLVEDVGEESPAAKAGIRKGDVVVEFDGERVRSARHLGRLVQETAEGRTVKATILREGARQAVDVTPSRERGRLSGDVALPALPENFERDLERSLRAIPRNFAFDFNWDAEWPDVSIRARTRMGAQLSPLSHQLADYFGAKAGVLVSSVEEDSAAAKAGLKAGDVITSINGRAVEGPRDVTEQLRDAEAGQTVEIGVVRDKKSLTLKAQMPERRRPSPRYVRPA